MDKNELTKKYSNGEITIIWQPGKCIHSTRCWKGETGLPEVFNPRERPWIKPEGADTETIIAHIANCPSGALSYVRNGETNQETKASETTTVIEVSPNGPLIIKGAVTISKDNNMEQRDGTTALCRCGQSSNKPFCDGTHRKIDFKA